MSPTFKIVFNGLLHQDTDITFAQEQLSQLLKIPHDIVIQLFDGESYALKKDLPSINAVKKLTFFIEHFCYSDKNETTRYKKQLSIIIHCFGVKSNPLK
ncbi:hypothetical protein J8L73_01790 [Pseudoalteromonas sp. MMG006]|uniref:hypothetical protein n=1 Tax=Pseudoalteromonas sp. MMG006 TaxID=2822683 RepID=UPI001B3936AF|nr:hypothetical protein [Pseudoalteromonas sp. MMG006]MBQ4797884.1 hypothetical protein [Pseudoalteromonas sp. MMG006]